MQIATKLLKGSTNTANTLWRMQIQFEWKKKSQSFANVTNVYMYVQKCTYKDREAYCVWCYWEKVKNTKVKVLHS